MANVPARYVSLLEGNYGVVWMFIFRAIKGIYFCYLLVGLVEMEMRFTQKHM